MKRAWIQPTGNELIEGVIEDTDSPMLAQILSGAGYRTHVAPPVPDRHGSIRSAIEEAAGQGCALMVLIGGSGGGRRFDPALAPDLTHSAMDSLLCDRCATELYGKNGHLWSRLVCGYVGEMLVCNVPGPYDEARAAALALSRWREEGQEELNRSMAGAVRSTYGWTKEEKRNENRDL